jgi:hypothetical protein
MIHDTDFCDFDISYCSLMFLFLARWRFIRDLAPFLRPRGVHDMRAQDLRLRHQAVRNAVLRRYCTHRCFWHQTANVFSMQL